MIKTSDTLITHRLKNGLTVYILRDPSASLISVKTFVRAGSIHEDNFWGHGLSHFLEHLLAGGPTTQRSEADYKALIAKLGGAFNAYTTHDHTCYYINTVPTHLNTAIEILSEWMFENNFSEKEFFREKEVITREIEKDAASISRQFFRSLQESFYRVHPARYPVLGYLENFKTVQPEDLKAYYRKHYTPSNMALVIGGNIDPDQAMGTIESKFGKYLYTASAPQLSIAEPPISSPRTINEEGNTQISYFGMRFPTVNLDSEDLYPLDLLDFILGNGDNSILNHTLVETQKLAYSISTSSVTPQIGGGYFEILAETDAHHIPALTKSIQAIIHTLQNEPVSSRQLKQAKNQKIADDAFSIETIEDKVDRIGQGYVYAQDPLFHSHYTKKFAKITAEEVQKAAQTYLKLDKALIAILKPLQPKIKTDNSSTPETPHVQMPQKEVLANGFRILLYEDHSQPIIHTQLFMRGGLRTETQTTNGITSLVAQHLGKETALYSKRKIQDLIEGKGASLSGSPGNNTLSMSMSCLSEDFKKLFPIFSASLLTPKFSEEEQHLILRNQKKRIAKRVDDWYTYGHYHFKKRFFQDHPYHMSLLGELESLKTITPYALQAHLDRHLNPQEMVLTIFGDFDTDTCLPLIEDAFKSLSPRPIHDAALVRQHHTHKTTYTLPISQDVCGIFIGFDGLSLSENSQQRLGLDLMTSAFSGIHYPSGRLHNSLREKGLVYMVNATHTVGIEPGIFTVCALTSPAQQEEALDAIYTEIKAIQSEPVSQDEFEQALAQLHYFYKEQLTSLSGLSVTCALDELYGLGFDYSLKVDTKFNKLTINHIQEAAQKYLINPQELVAVGPV